MRRNPGRQAFTLIELMVTVSIIGILSAIAIPSFSRLIARSKTAETSANLSSLFKSAAAYYAAERATQGQGATVSGYCTVDDAGPVPLVPDHVKQSFVADSGFRAIGFSVSDEVYFSYGLASAGGGVSSCGHSPKDTGLYTFYSNGDLNGDGIQSTFELAAGSDGSNVLYHSVGIHVINELE
jgi:prepilin-type N-terminal cleavage/methylation domain-containing protein